MNTKHVGLLIVGLGLVNSACATTYYEKCLEFTENPYGLRMDMTEAELNELFASVPKSTVEAKTRLEWMRYGSVEGCMEGKRQAELDMTEQFYRGYALGKDMVPDGTLDTFNEGMRNQAAMEAARNQPKVIFLRK